MEPQSSFHPGNVKVKDNLIGRLYDISRLLFIVGCGLLPILFIPTAFLPLSSGKTFIMVVVLALAILFFVLSILKEGSLSLKFPLPVVAMWSVAIATAGSAILSGDLMDSFLGDTLESYTVFFTVLMAVLVTSVGIIGKDQKSIIRLYAVLIGGGLVLSLFHIIRFIFGPNSLSFGLFIDPTSSPIGSWNGLAIFYGLVILLSLLVLQQLPLSSVGRYVIFGVTALSLFMLALVNFSIVWWILAAISGSIAVYHLIGHFWRKGSMTALTGPNKTSSSIAAVAVLVVSLIFLIGGVRLGGEISNRLGLSFFEVRPSLTATIEIAKPVFKEDLFFGFGANRFTDAWRIYKSPEMNETIFWDTQFDSGYSYILTSVVNNGLVGLVAWIFFFVALILSGIKFIFRSASVDKFWHFIGLSSLLASTYFWLIALTYVPPPSILLLASITTGIFVFSSGRLESVRSINLSVSKNRTHGFVLIMLAVLFVSVTGYGTYLASKQISGVYSFTKAISTIDEGDTLASVEEEIARAFTLSPNDFFARQIALYRLTEMQAMLSISEPTAEQQQAFQDSVSRGIQAANTAVSLDSTNPYNYRVLGQIYSVLALVGVEGAYERAGESYSMVRKYDPINPTIPLLEADLAVGKNESSSARSLAEKSVALKSNYTEALFFLAQLDISEGNIDRAITIVTGLAQMEPGNPARRYQLGILLASNGRLDEAIAAFEQAVALDQQYANAHYFLALGYAEKGRIEEAIEQLSIVMSLNEANSSVASMIEELRTTGSLSVGLTQSDTVSERTPSSDNITNEDLESGLVTHSNPIGGEENSNANTAE